jgi:hypothetical protein
VCILLALGLHRQGMTLGRTAASAGRMHDEACELEVRSPLKWFVQAPVFTWVIMNPLRTRHFSNERRRPMRQCLAICPYGKTTRVIGEASLVYPFQRAERSFGRATTSAISAVVDRIRRLRGFPRPPLPVNWAQGTGFA